MLRNRQTITAQCDVCGFEKIVCNEIIPEGGKYLIPYPPEGWWTVGIIAICPKHTKIVINGKAGQGIEIENYEGFNL